MRRDLDHLPEGKRRELTFVVDVIREGFAQAISRRTQDRYRNGAILKIVLFGSYARGDWVADPVGRYFSDFDLLIITNHEDLTDPSEFWGKTEGQLLDELSSGETLRTPVSLIIHSMDEVNDQLLKGRDFFVDILKDGILLDERDPAAVFVSPKPLDARSALQETEELFQWWFAAGLNMHTLTCDARNREMLKESAFLLHQSAERFYHCVLLVRALYSPKTHNLNRLRSLCDEVDGRLKAVWPKETRFQRRAYDLLRSAYVKSRYSDQYRIELNQLDWLIGRVAELQAIVDVVCRERIAVLRSQVDDLS